MKDFLTIGSVTVDLFLKDDKFGENNLGGFVMGNKYDMQDYFIRIGGSAYNTAKFFSEFGYLTSLMSCVSDKYYGRLICSKVKKQKNLSAKFLEVNKDIKTSFSVIMISKLRERVILKHSCFEKGFHFFKKNLKKHRAICLSSLSGREDVLTGVFEHVLKNKKFLSFNPGNKDFDFLKNNLNYLKIIDVFTLNNVEASLFSGIDKKEIFKILKYFSDKVKVFVMTMGKDGSYVCCNDKIYKCGVYENTQVEDVTGAGDAFYSGFVLGYYLYEDLEFALKIGNLNASEVIKEIGSCENLLTFKKYVSLKEEKINELKIERIYE
jgi:sugar/nucleoside kinase (ribokinase family)